MGTQRKLNFIYPNGVDDIEELILIIIRYLFKFIDEMIKKSENKPKIIQMQFKNISKASPLNYDLFFGD